MTLGSELSPQKTLGPRLTLWSETQLRIDLNRTEMQQTLFRTGLLKNLGARHRLGFLYDYIDSGETNEHRLALQHSNKTFAQHA